MGTFVPTGFTTSDKRQRVTTFSRPRRNVNKEIIVIRKSSIQATQLVTNLVIATFPFTFTGLRWNFAVHQNAGTGEGLFSWCIAYVPDGETIDVMSRTDASGFYTPEQNCLVWGFGVIDNNSNGLLIEGTTKTMRKMMTGDALIFAILGTGATNVLDLTGAIQFFQKM